MYVGKRFQSNGVREEVGEGGGNGGQTQRVAAGDQWVLSIGSGVLSAGRGAFRQMSTGGW